MPGTQPPEAPSTAADGPIELSNSALIEDLGPASTLSEQRAASLVGKVVSDRYRVDAILGQGGMGAVYLGEQIHLRKQIAIKVLHPDMEMVPGLVERFEREGIAGAHVQHPNVAAAIDFGKLDDGSYFLVLEYVEGVRLTDVMKGGPLPAPRALRIARQMAAALEAVHDKGVIHRDIKPQNTLLGAGDHVKIIDFGLAKVRLDNLSEVRRREPDKPLTGMGVMFGTPAYIAPEAALGMRAVDARSDLYALGITLYEMLVARHPFDWVDASSLFQQQRTQDPPPLHTRAPEIAVPPEAERITMRLIQRNPADRYQSAREVVAAIDEALATIEGAARGAVQETVATGPSPAAAPRVPGGPSRSLLLVVALGSLLVGGLLVLALRGRGSRENTVAPTATAVVSAPPVPTATASATAAPTEVDGIDAAGWRARLDKAARIKNWVLGSKAFLALVELDPTLLDDEVTRANVVAVAAGIAFEGKSELSDDVFEAITSRLGTSGLDLLFEIVRSRGGTRGGHRARELLSRPEVRARATPALRIAFDFHVAACTERHALVDRAAAEGDRRTLVQMEIVHGASCSNKKDPCCFREDTAMAESIQTLRGRLGN